MQLVVVCNKQTIEIEQVEAVNVIVNGGLTIGVGVDGVSIFLTPEGMPTLVSSFLWDEFLRRLLTESKK